MAPRKPKDEDKLVTTRLNVDQIFDAIHDPENPGYKHVDLIDGELDGKKATFIAAERDGDMVPLALILDAKTAKRLNAIIEAKNEAEEEDDDEDDEDEDEDDGFEP